MVSAHAVGQFFLRHGCHRADDCPLARLVARLSFFRHPLHYSVLVVLLEELLVAGSERLRHAVDSASHLF